MDYRRWYSLSCPPGIIILHVVPMLHYAWSLLRNEVYAESILFIIWATSRENLSSGFPPKRVSNQSPQLQRLARKLKFHL